MVVNCPPQKKSVQLLEFSWCTSTLLSICLSNQCRCCAKPPKAKKFSMTILFRQSLVQKRLLCSLCLSVDMFSHLCRCFAQARPASVHFFILSRLNKVKKLLLLLKNASCRFLNFRPILTFPFRCVLNKQLHFLRQETFSLPDEIFLR